MSHSSLFLYSVSSSLHPPITSPSRNFYFTFLPPNSFFFYLPNPPPSFLPPWIPPTVVLSRSPPCLCLSLPLPPMTPPHILCYSTHSSILIHTWAHIQPHTSIHSHPNSTNTYPQPTLILTLTLYPYTHTRIPYSYLHLHSTLIPTPIFPSTNSYTHTPSTHLPGED